jgi:hypothetical protein
MIKWITKFKTIEHTTMSTLDVIQIMLRQRGIPSDVVEDIESEFQATIHKISNVLVFIMNRSRISSEKDIRSIVSIMEENGGTLSIVVVPVKPSETVRSLLRQYSDKIQLFHIGQLQFDITTHRKVPPHRILSTDEKKAFQEKFHIQTPATQMPLIDSQDPMALWIGAIPGDIVEVMRRSETAGGTPYYRFCVADVTL